MLQWVLRRIWVGCAIRELEYEISAMASLTFDTFPEFPKSVSMGSDTSRRTID
jgi:hypothetical protein